MLSTLVVSHFNFTRNVLKFVTVLLYFIFVTILIYYVIFLSPYFFTLMKCIIILLAEMERWLEKHQVMSVLIPSRPLGT